VCRRIKTSTDARVAATPVLHLSASFVTSQDKAHGLEIGADAYLVRPVEPVELVATVNALLRARRSEEALRQSEERFRMMANSIPQLAWMARPDGHIFWYNQRWYDYTGTRFEQMQGWGWQAVHDPAELPRVAEKFKAHLASGEAWEDTFPLRRRDGQFRWHLSRARPLRGADGTIVLWFGTNTDVTDQRQAEQELRRSRDEAETARAQAEEARAQAEAARAAAAEADRANRLKD
jgi:PAS domain S-box-containing protein